MAETRATCPVVGASHFLLSHASHAINCRVEPITAYALDGFNGLVGTYSGAVTLTTQSGRGTWSLISGNGTLVEATPDDGNAATSSFRPTTARRHSVCPTVAGASPLDIDVYQTDDPTIRDDNTDGNIAFGPNGFTVTAAPLAQPTAESDRIADSRPRSPAPQFPIHLTAYGQTPTDPQCGVIETYTGPHALQFWMDHLNPAPGVLNATVNGTGVGSSEATRNRPERDVQLSDKRRHREVQRRRIDSPADEGPGGPSGRNTRLDQFVRRQTGGTGDQPRRNARGGCPIPAQRPRRDLRSSPPARRFESRSTRRIPKAA